MPRETASVASGARMAERSQCRASQRAWMPDASVRRRGVGNPEACHRTSAPSRSRRRDGGDGANVSVWATPKRATTQAPQAGADAGTVATARTSACGQPRSVPPTQAPPSRSRRRDGGDGANVSVWATPKRSLNARAPKQEPTPGRWRRRDRQRVGNPEACARNSRCTALVVHATESLRRSAATTGCGTNRSSASSSASGVTCFRSDDEMWE